MICSVRSSAISAKPIFVSVNGIAIPRNAIAREAQHHPAPSPMAAWKEAARALAIRELLLQEAQRLELAAEPLTDGKDRRETDEEALIRALIEREVKTPEPDMDSCWRYYEQNRGRFRTPDIYEAAHILFAALAKDVVAYGRAREVAKGILAELNAHPERFADLAGLHSACPSGAQGGNLGQITSGQTTPEFERALISLAPDSLCEEPVATRYGHHIIRLDRKIEGRELPFEAVAARIADYLAESVERRAVAQYIARLASRARIEGIELAGVEALRVH
ncbi:MAG: peptidylprolyl isomerase [Xanthobacteraceae bacterium]|nr:peptidylprolyl isomerase [Xanthobacteraceae bacterium]